MGRSIKDDSIMNVALIAAAVAVVVIAVMKVFGLI